MRRPIRVIRSALLPTALTIVAACDARGDGGSTEPVARSPLVAEVVISPKLDTIFVRDSLTAADARRLTATVLGFTGTAITSVPVRWSTADTLIASVDSLTGVVAARRVGTARVVATAGSKRDESTVVIAYASARLAITSARPVAAGQAPRTADTIFVRAPITPQQTTALRVVAVGVNGDTLRGFRYAWSSSDPTVATVDSTGMVTARAIGRTTITATGAGGEATRPVAVTSVVRELRLAAPATTVLVDDTLRFTGTATGWDGQPVQDLRIQWSSSNPTIATIDSTGLARFLTRGTVRFTAASHFVSASTGTVGNVENPTAIDRLFLTVRAGTDYTCGTVTLGRVYCWGRRAEGQLGTAAQDTTCFDTGGATVSCSLLPKRTPTPLAFAQVTVGSTPTLVTSALTFDTTAGSLSVGGTHVCGITTPARIVHCWGDDGSGQLGTQVVTVNSTTPVPAELPPTPSTLAARWVSAGYRHSCAVARTGEAFCWGSNASGEIGNGTQGGTATVPTPVAGAFAYRTISASPIALRPNGGTANTDDNEAHTCALTTEGNAVCWGANASGQTGGSPGVRYVTTPTRIESGLSFADISTGGGFTCAVDTNRAVYCWGRNDLGQLGTGAPGSPTRGPTRVAGAVAVDESGRVVGIPGVQYVSVTAGRRHACAVSTGGEVYCWGSDVAGALGTPVQAPVQAVPTRVAKPL